MLEKMKSELNEQKLAIEILQAEKDSLQAEKESIQAEKKSIEVKFNEVSLKLKQKTQQYDSLLKSQGDREQNNAEKSSAVPTQQIKLEPGAIGAVNLPASLSSRPNEPDAKTATKRKNATKNDSKKTKAKKKKVKDSLTSPKNAKESIPSGRLFTCDECLRNWGKVISCDFQGDPDNSRAPDPKQFIRTFSSFEAYADHLYDGHGFGPYVISNFYRVSTSFVCKTCDCRFQSQGFLDNHEEFEHFDPNLTNRQIYELSLERIKRIY